MIFEHNLTHIKIADLQFDKSNPNQLTQEQMKGLRLSMERFGYLTPIVVDQHGLIADGEHRALVYKEFGLTEIPCYRVTFSDDTERRLLRQTMNKLRGQHDFAMDADEMVLIYESNKLPDLSGLIAQQETTLKELMLKYRPELPFGHENDQQLDELIDEQLQKTAPDTKLGDIIQLGNHRLICADCTDKRSIDRLFEDKRPNAIITDPPYGMNYKGETFGKDGMSNDNIDWQKTLQECLKTGLQYFNSGTIAIFFGSSRLDYIFKMMQGLTFHRILTIYKPHRLGFPWYGWVLTQEHILLFSIGKAIFNSINHCHDVYTYNYNESEKRDSSLDHPTIKPLIIVSDIVKKCSNQNNIIYDPFLGSGSTLIACEQTGRICYGCEIDPHYCDVIIKRWENYTNNKAVRL